MAASHDSNYDGGGGLVLPPLEGMPRARVTCAIKKAIERKIRECKGSEVLFEMHNAHVMELLASRKLAGKHLRESLGKRTRQHVDLKTRLDCARRHEEEVRQRREGVEQQEALTLLRKHEHRLLTVHNQDWVRMRHWLAHAYVARSALRFHSALHRSNTGRPDRWGCHRNTHHHRGEVSGLSADPTDRLAGTASLREAQRDDASPHNLVDPEKAHRQMLKLQKAERYRGQLSPEQLRAVMMICSHM